MPNVFPESVQMIARPRSQAAPESFAKEDQGAGTFTVNTVDKTVSFELAPALEKSKISIHGFVPRGWKTDALIEIERGETRGVWSYHRSQEKNILDGLT